MDSKDALFLPFELNGLQLKNRIMSTSHAIAYQQEGKPQARYQAYHEEKAKGGLALTMFGGSSNIDLDSASVFGQLYLGNDDIIEHLQQFSDRIHAHQTALMCQITHLGRRSSDRGDWWLPTIGPSRSREPLHRAFCKEMDRYDIARVQQAYVDAALRCKAGGIDGIEIMAGSHLPGQFLSPLSNQRSDRYGGSLENRSRFLVETLTKIREAVGQGFNVGLRLPCAEEQGGIGFDDSTSVANHLAQTSLVDFLNVYFGRMDAEHNLADNHLPGMASKSAPFLERAGEFKRAVHVPVFHATRVSDIATARHAIRAGLVDMIAMTRAHIADPHLVNKIARGEEDRVRPCVGATLCSTDYRVCVHNAATGAEQHLSHTIDRSNGPFLKAVVIGAGPAGLEAARVLALRGHQVALYEAQSQLGGQVLLAAKAPWRKDMLGIVDWLTAEIQTLGVAINYNHYVSAEEINTLDPDLVIVACGGMPDTTGIENLDLCLSSWDVLSGELPAGEDIVVIDETGRHAGSSVADFLAAKGKNVELISNDGHFGRELTETDSIAQRRRFAQLGVKVDTDLELLAVQRTNAGLKLTLQNVLTSQQEIRDVHHAVIERGTEPMDEIFQELSGQSLNGGVTDFDSLVLGAQQPQKNESGYYLYRVGDAISSRGIHEAIKDSLRLCSAL